MRQSERVLPRTRRCHGDLDSPHADADQGAKLQQFQPDRAAGGLGELRVRQPNAAQAAQQGASASKAPASRSRRQSVRLETQTPAPGETTHRTSAAMANHIGIGVSSVQRIWRKHGPQPHKTRHFKLSNDPRFAEKLLDIVGTYVNPPEHPGFPNKPPGGLAEGLIFR